jgi:hypothetical protein
LATCAFDHIIKPSKVLFIQGWLTTPGDPGEVIDEPPVKVRKTNETL